MRDLTPLRLHKISSCRRTMQPSRLRSFRNSRRWRDRSRLAGISVARTKPFIIGGLLPCVTHDRVYGTIVRPREHIASSPMRSIGRIVGQRVRRAMVLTPDNIVGRIRDAIVAVIARHAGRNDRDRAGRIKLRSVPSQARQQRRQAGRDERSANSAQIQNMCHRAFENRPVACISKTGQGDDCMVLWLAFFFKPQRLVSRWAVLRGDALGTRVRAVFPVCILAGFESSSDSVAASVLFRSR